MSFTSVKDVKNRMEQTGYIPSQEIATIVFLAQETQKPILIEGPAGVGKTELAKSISACLEQEMIRLQCYEGLDESKALYEWAYAKQLLYTQMLKEKINDVISTTATLKDRSSCYIPVLCSPHLTALIFSVRSLFYIPALCSPHLAALIFYVHSSFYTLVLCSPHLTALIVSVC